MKDKVLPLVGLGVALGAFAFLRGSRLGNAQKAMPSRTRGKGDPNITLEYARKWGPVFMTPVSYIMVIAHIESAHNPRLVNMAAVKKGGAWGLGQQMADEAGEKVKRILGTWGHLPEVQATAKKWTGNPNDLLDPDLNVMLMAWQLGKAYRKFGSFYLTAAAYHQGEGGISRRLAQGQPAVDPTLQPKGVTYVNRALQIVPLYAQV